MDRWLILGAKSTGWLVQPGGSVWQDADSPERQREFLTVVLFATAMILLIWLISRMQARLGRPAVPHRPWHVFRLLLRSHKLGLSDRLLLCVIARGQGIKQPTVLLLSPTLFSRYATQWLSESRVAALWPGVKERLTRIAQQVFAESPA